MVGLANTAWPARDTGMCRSATISPGEDSTVDLIANTAGLAAGAAGHAATAAEVEGGAAATSVATTAVMPGTASPAVIAGTARVIEHGANKLAVSTAGSLMVASVAEALGEMGLGYGITETSSTAALTV
ncbi:hypothetical protein MAHJHV58_46200 [Mycobacterium avium subsp. hominissuis]|nr:hypothetical protein CKJ55_24605 [Mycobacterium avium]PBA81526.1 hypothetical protein CKJ71_24870 [Mycobacterium avium]